jgi:PHD/YefM family antitoxin component YafN of YafNO toxin-antitoxin module
MVIKPSAAIRNNYRKVADYCIETGQPVYLTNNGEGELVVMSHKAWEKLNGRALEMMEDFFLLALAEERLRNDNGRTYTHDEIMKKYGITDDDLNDIPMEYGVDFE